MEGKAKIDFSANFGMSKVVKMIDVLDAATYAEYRNEQTINGYTYDGKEYVADNNLPYPIPGRWSYTKVKDPATGIEMVSDSTYLPGPQDFRDGYMNGGTNWQDQIYQSAFSQDYNLSISGGDAKGHYLFSGGMLDVGFGGRHVERFPASLAVESEVDAKTLAVQFDTWCYRNDVDQFLVPVSQSSYLRQ